MNSSMRTNSMSKGKSLSFSERSKLCKNETARNLCFIIDKKKTNLCFNPDVTSSENLLDLAEAAGPYICLLKTHIDILEDFSETFLENLTAIAKRHNFLIFEDRKFADIGNTVKLQYEKGIYHIADWSDITNAHIIAGPGTIEGLKAVGLPKKRGLLLLAEMSSKGNMAKGDYTQEAINLAEKHSDFVMGFISMKKLSHDPKFLHLTPGVKKHPGSDNLGQQYKTPESVIFENQSDIIIVGRGIYESQNPQKEAQEFAQRGYEAYLKRLS